MVPSGNFEFASGSPIKKVTLKHHELGFEMTPHICSECGSVLAKTADDDRFRGVHIVFAGTLDGDAADKAELTQPQMELWTKYRHGWVKPLDIPQKVGFE